MSDSGLNDSEAPDAEGDSSSGLPVETPMQERVRLAADEFEFGALITGVSGADALAGVQSPPEHPPGKPSVTIPPLPAPFPANSELPGAFRPSHGHQTDDAVAGDASSPLLAENYWKTIAPPVPARAPAAFPIVKEPANDLNAGTVLLRAGLALCIAVMAFGFGLGGREFHERVDISRAVSNASFLRPHVALLAGLVVLALCLMFGSIYAVRVSSEDSRIGQLIFRGTVALFAIGGCISGTVYAAAFTGLDARVAEYNRLLDEARSARKEAVSARVTWENVKRASGPKTDAAARARAGQASRSRWEARALDEGRALQRAQRIFEGLLFDPDLKLKYREGERCLPRGLGVPKPATSAAANLVYFKKR